MHRFGFTTENLRRELRATDFYSYPELRNDAELAGCLSNAVACLGRPNEIAKHISYRMLRKKSVASANSHFAKIALRLVNSNIVSAFGSKTDDRESIVRALVVILSETVRYRVYKFDVKGFYESFDAKAAMSKVEECTALTDPVKRVISNVVDHHSESWLTGLPRGLVVSASLSDALMAEFDEAVSSHADVFFYRRYVDDITVVTSGREDVNPFTTAVEALLPKGLRFKKVKNKVKFLSAFRPKESIKTPVTTGYVDFDYLGYRFYVASSGHQPGHLRQVWLDIAQNKVNKIKTRIIKSYVDYLVNKDFGLLEMRVKHLTSNISLRNRATGLRRLSGIFHSYPLVDVGRSLALLELDRFLKSSIRAPSGTIFRQLDASTSSQQKAMLLRHSFYSGARNRRFYQFGMKELARIQRCWKYA